MGEAGGKAGELADLLRELYERAGSPTYAKLARQGAGQRPPVALGATVLSDWFNGRGVPADPERFAFLVTWLEHEAARRDRAYVATPAAAWERLRGEAERERRPAGRPHTPRGGDPVLVGGDFVGRPVREFTDAFALEVHRAIDAPEHAQARLSDLPVYIPRAHDRELRTAVERAAGGESVMVTLVAGSSTGKTRACWEALRAVPDGWRLWHPLHPSPAEAAATGLSRVGPRTVVWLNEAQTYLEPATAGERIATGLRELLNDPRRAPVLVLATLWPDPFWNALSTRPATGASDPHVQARALLTGTDVRVPEMFTGADLDAVRARAIEDPRLAKALTGDDDGRVTQFLAGAPALLKRLDLAPAHARAVIEGAMDARRLGHGPILRQAFLEDAADAYLTDTESDALHDDWFEQALAYAAHPVHGAIAPLTRIRPRRRPRRDPDDGPTYRLADYLEQHARHTRGALCPGASFWEAAHDHAHVLDDSLNLAQAAHDRLRIRHAERIYAKAAESREPRAMTRLASLRAMAGDHDGAERLTREAADAGNARALARLSSLRKEAGDHEGAERLAREATAAGYPYQLLYLAGQRELAGDREGAERVFRELADTGSTFALGKLAEMRDEVGDHDGAERLTREAAEAGDTGPLMHLAWRREVAGNLDGAQRLYLIAAHVGDTRGLVMVAEIREKAGDLDTAESLYLEAAEAGDMGGLRGLAGIRERAGDRHEAEHLARMAADAGYPFVLELLAEIREEAGDHDDADRLTREASDAGHPYALEQLAKLREKAGEHHDAERLRTWSRRGLDPGDEVPPASSGEPV